MNKELIIEKSINYVKETLNNSSSSHDWWHIYRVWNLAKQISQNENSDLFIVEFSENLVFLLISCSLKILVK